MDSPMECIAEPSLSPHLASNIPAPSPGDRNPPSHSPPFPSIESTTEKGRAVLENISLSQSPANYFFFKFECNLTKDLLWVSLAKKLL